VTCVKGENDDHYLLGLCLITSNPKIGPKDLNVS